MTEQTGPYELEKSVWTQDDFEGMGWHDANIYGMAFESGDERWAADFLLDMDYIFGWVDPIPPAVSYTFWVAPCTLVFHQCFDLHIEINSIGGCVDALEISDLHLNDIVKVDGAKDVYVWTIELQQGQITLKSYGYEQIVRQKPRHVHSQVLTMEERGGISYGRNSC